MAKQMSDEARFSIELPENISTIKIKHHTVQYSVVGKPLTIYLNNSAKNSGLWQIPEAIQDWYSKNLDELEMNLEWVIIFTNIVVGESLAGQLAEGQEYYIRYFLNINDSTIIIGEIVDEIDLYRAKFYIDYNDNGVKKTIGFYVPGSVYKYLLGLDLDQPAPWIPGTTIDPNIDTQLFVDYFARLNDLLTADEPYATEDPWKTLAYSKIVNRNMPKYYAEASNPFITNDVPLLKSICESDVLEHDSLYPTFVKLELEYF